MVLMISASCATKNGVIITAPAWLGPTVSDVTITPAGPYYVGDDITVAVVATAANTGTLTYLWTLTGTWGTITAGATTDEATISLDAVGTNVTGKVAVTETVNAGAADEQAKTVEKTFTLTVAAPLNAAPVIATLTATGNALAATFSDADGDALTVDWAATAGTVTPGAADNTTASATFVPPAGNGTATITLTVADAFADDTATVDIDYVLDPFAGIADDTIFLYTPVSSIATGAFTYVFIGARVATAKPLGNLNSVRLLVANTQILVTGIGAMTQSATNLTFANDFAMGMEGDAVSGGDALYDSYVGYDAWAGFADQSGVGYLPSPALAQATFTDAGINWGNNALEFTGNGFICVLKVRGIGAGANPIEIDSTPARTFYSDLAGTQYTFAITGPAKTITVG